MDGTLSFISLYLSFSLSVSGVLFFLVVVNIVISLWKSLGNIIDTQSLKIRIHVHMVLMCIYLANIFDIRK